MRHVADIRHSQALADAGIVVDSYFRWIDSVVSRQYEIASNPLFKPVGSIPAPLPCELMEVMPDTVIEEGVLRFPNITKYNGVWDVGYEYTHGAHSNPANALCDMLLWLNGEGLLEQ